MKHDNPDGTVTKIEYRSAFPLQRAPYFELSDQTLKMSFNGIVWYEASIVDEKTKEWVEEGEFICESSNMTVYRASRHAEYAYAYLLTLNGTDDSVILFYTNDSPFEQGYGTDFSVSVRYFVDKEETVPDVVFEK